MKSGIFAFAAVALLQLAAAQPHRQRHHHEKRELAVLYFREGEDTPYSTRYEKQAPAATSAPAAEAAAQAPPAATTSASSAPASSYESSGSSGSSGSGLGIVFSPYTKDEGCITDPNKIKKTLDKFNGFKMVRLYGTDCNQVANMIPIAKERGMKIFAGVFHIDQVVSEVQSIINAAKDSWDTIDTISIGNEAIHKGGSAGAVTAAIATAREMLSKAGYKGSIVTADTTASHLAHPELCKASDYCAVNCHAFFNPNQAAKDAGPFVLSQAQMVASQSGKKVVITESGWPHKGTKGNNVGNPTLEEQTAAIASLKQTFSSDLILFTAEDDPWKEDGPDTCGAEKFWGIQKL